ncbi:hypothetical protein MLD38_003538 [Melastoma candidum]|uniref:Uncharacterized protein n=1 Tax=Melastoma candidum TaxID=119954 RepID=A0ACB9SBE7_9MYRT|nr:hypothetical protein MLD38_003538 [Melastoma candidum]
MILEEMYRMGTHTPSASQIRQITAQLPSYGEIEGKNVFGFPPSPTNSFPFPQFRPAPARSGMLGVFWGFVLDVV